MRSLLVGLIFLLLEFRRLTSLIGKEKSDLSRFENDLSEFEADAGKKSSDELVNYIKDSLAKGMSVEQVEYSLVKRGWPKKEVDSIIESIQKR